MSGIADWDDVLNDHMIDAWPRIAEIGAANIPVEPVVIGTIYHHLHEASGRALRC